MIRKIFRLKVVKVFKQKNIRKKKGCCFKYLNGGKLLIEGIYQVIFGYENNCIQNNKEIRVKLSIKFQLLINIKYGKKGNWRI